MTDDAVKRPNGPRNDVENAVENTVVLDAQGLRALAHPVRVRLVGLLRRYGPSTATRLAERLGVNTGTTSYHLRQLGAAGFVEEDAERGNARERWWRAVHQTTRFNDRDLADQEPEATLAYFQSVAATYALRVQQTLSELSTLPDAWREVFDLSDRALRLTPEEAVALREELSAVVARYRGDTPEAAASAPEGAVRVGVITNLLPESDAPAGSPEWDTSPTPPTSPKHRRRPPAPGPEPSA